MYFLLRSVTATRLWMTTSVVAIVATIAVLPLFGSRQAIAQVDAAEATQRPLTLQSDIQEANAKTGVVTARGNVQIDYPARAIRATSAQVQYFSRERRIVLSGNVYVVQDGNSLQGETITYLIDEGRFIALPGGDKEQVQSIYQVLESTEEEDTAPTAPGVAPF